MQPTVADPLTEGVLASCWDLIERAVRYPQTPMGERTATTIDPEDLADAILADQPAAQTRTTSPTRKHLERLSPELADRLVTSGARRGHVGPTTQRLASAEHDRIPLLQPGWHRSIARLHRLPDSRGLMARRILIATSTAPRHPTGHCGVGEWTMPARHGQATATTTKPDAISRTGQLGCLVVTTRPSSAAPHLGSRTCGATTADRDGTDQPTHLFVTLSLVLSLSSCPLLPDVFLHAAFLLNPG